ncbi:MAG: histidine ammonia-lyase [Candidatus Thermoplasmatota archaeon]|nr:histidine ammonia-lyase [Candidatus Thermoplasmatota archaeon]
MILLTGSELSIDDVVSCAREFEIVKLSVESNEKMLKSQDLVMELLHSHKTVYGVNTGFGSLSTEKISEDDVESLQVNLLRSHSCGVGEPLPVDVVRAMMLLRANSLAKGYSGIRPCVVQLLIDMLNKQIHPVVPRKGSIGASGDLVPLAHIGLCLIGEGTVVFQDTEMSLEEAFEKTGLKPVSLQAKEGLALINGTQLMSALGCLFVSDAEQLLKHAQIAGALSLEALKGTNLAFRKEIHQLRPHKGQMECAKNLWRLTQDSTIHESHLDCGKVQDAYTLRCMPQVFGASKDVFSFVKNVLETEINSVTDNPVLLPDSKESLSGGNFHGQPLAFALDFLAISLAELGDFSERRIARLVDENLSGLPAFLTKYHGLHSGLMLPQYVAASLVNENKTLCHPNSVDSISSSANKEDHVSMGANAGLKLFQITENVRTVLAIELVTSTQGLEFLKPLTPAKALQPAVEEIRKKVSKLDEDRPLHNDIKIISNLIANGWILSSVESVMGHLQ